MSDAKQRGNAWFLLPIILGIVGGVIAFFVLRQDDPAKAKNCLYIGIALMLVGTVLNIILVAYFPELGTGFDVNV